jgi:hypothetical protein
MGEITLCLFSFVVLIYAVYLIGKFVGLWEESPKHNSVP